MPSQPVNPYPETALPEHRRALAALVTVQVLFGSLPVVAQLAFPAFGARGVAAWRLGAAALAFHAFARATRMPWLPWREHPRVLLLALLGVSGNQILFLEGLSRTSALHAALLTTTIPVLTLVAAVALRRETLSWRRAAGIPVALVGVLVLLAQRDPSGHATLTGDAMIVANASIYSLYLVLSRDLLARWPTMAVLPWLFTWGFVSALPLTGLPPLHVPDPHMAGQAWAALAWVVLGPTIGTYWLNLVALRVLPSSTVALLIYLQPFVAASLALPLLGEAPTWAMLAAAGITFVGVRLATRREETPTPNSPVGR